MRIPPSPPQWTDVFSDPVRLGDVLRKSTTKETRDFVGHANHLYLHWQKLRFHPIPEGMTPADMWFAVAMSRRSQIQQLPLMLADEHNSYLWYWTPPRHQEWLHRIDQDAGGFIGSRTRLVPEDDDDRFLFNSLMEEAIASSQLEGASTTRDVAKAMLRAKRKPRNRHEQMILNNYHAILEIRDLREQPLTPQMLCRIQEIITHNTLEHPEAAGRFKGPDDPDNCIVDSINDEILFKPPTHHHMEWMIEQICDFANTKQKEFVHPVVKAIALHFIIGYAHPFVDGNGRTARAVFYWYMLKSGYWIFEYLPISRIVLDSQTSYGRAYLYTETDDWDLTYFIHYNLRVIDRAVREMHEYFVNQQMSMRRAREAVDSFGELNHRQVAVAYDAIQNPHARFTIKQHAGTHHIAQATARADLFGLEEKGILQKQADGKRWVFVQATHLKERLKKGAFRRSPRRNPS